MNEERPFPFQEEGGRFLAPRRLALLADEMGLGKSAQAVLACDAVCADRVLVLCPAVARENWIREFEKWSDRGRRWKAITSSHQVAGPNQSATCSYQLIGKGHHVDIFDDEWDALILDEGHYLKEHDAGRTRAVLGNTGLIHHAKRVWWLSGTPAPNHAGELWTMLFTAGRTTLGYDAFIRRYCVGYADGYKWRITGTNESMIPEIKRMLDGFMLRRRKTQVMKQLPPITYTDVTVPEGEVDLELCFPEYYYGGSGEDALLERIASERNALEACVPVVTKQSPAKALSQLLERMADSVSTLRRYDGLRKVDAAVDMISRELDNGDMKKVVIFAMHRHVIVALRDRLAKYKAKSVFGGTDHRRRQKIIDDFQNPDGKCRVFIGQIQAAGTAITLTAAHHVVFVEQAWTPGDNAQAAMRCHRIGQENPVSVRFLALPNSTDQRVTQVLLRKTRELTKIFDE